MTDLEIWSRGVADVAAIMLGQSYRWHKGTWWLFSFDSPLRPLTDEEIGIAAQHGLIPYRDNLGDVEAVASYFEMLASVYEDDLQGVYDSNEHPLSALLRRMEFICDVWISHEAQSKMQALAYDLSKGE